MTKQRRKSLVSFLTLGVIMMALLSAPVAGIAHHRPGHVGGPGGGGGGGGGTPTGWIENFNSFDEFEKNWAIEQTGPEQKFGIPGVGVKKSFDTSNVMFMEGGILRLKLNLWDDEGTLTSSGALVYSKEKYGYGTYEWCMRMSSTATSPDGLGDALSGNVSAGFVYVNNSETEIDFEFAGHLPGWLYMANWYNKRPRTDPRDRELTYSTAEFSDITDVFKAYKFEWTKDYIEFWVDTDRPAFHTENVPKASAHVMINHWGTHNPDGFGGGATLGDRYSYIDWVSYTPPGELLPDIDCGPVSP